MSQDSTLLETRTGSIKRFRRPGKGPNALRLARGMFEGPVVQGAWGLGHGDWGMGAEHLPAPKNPIPRAGGRAPTSQAPSTEPGSTFTPGPMVEEIATFWT